VLALLLPLLLALVNQQVLSGARDENYFLDYEYDEFGNETRTVQTGIGFWDRWTVAGYSTPPDRLLLPAAAVGVTLAVLHLAVGGRWPLPRVARWTGAGACALSAGSAAVVLVLELVEVQLPPGDRQGWSSTSPLLDLAAPLSAMVTVVAFAAVAGVVLLGPPLPRTEPVQPVEPESEPEPEPESEPAAPEDVLVEPVPDRGPAPTEVSFPRPSAEEYARYRRPAS
jgi:hypothetical protein